MLRFALIALLAAVLPSSAQPAVPGSPRFGGPVIIIVPEYYPAFDPAMRAAHPEAVEIHAVVDQRARLTLPSRETSTVVILSPAHLDAGTLRAALVVVHNYRARGAPQEPRSVLLVAIDSAGASGEVPTWARVRLEGTLDALRGRSVEELAHYGRVRKITIADPSAAVRPPASGREE